MAEESIAYDKSDLRKIYGAFKAMDEKSVVEAKGVSNGLALICNPRFKAQLVD